jgi:hypothetical protein
VQAGNEIVGLSADRSASASRACQGCKEQNFDRDENKTFRFVKTQNYLLENVRKLKLKLKL